MTSNRTILITGVTGNQGGAVAQALQGSTLAWALGPGTKLQMIAVDDIGWFGARAFTAAAALEPPRDRSRR